MLLLFLPVVAVRTCPSGWAVTCAMLNSVAVAALAARGCGFGLVCLTERVTALGGELRAGPRSGHGWAVSARLPTA